MISRGLANGSAAVVAGCASLALISLAMMAAPAVSAPAGGASSPLTVSHRVGLHVALSAEPDAIVAAEAPDGAVFFAKGTKVEAVDGNATPTVAETAATKVIALAASKASLYVETRTTVTAYSRLSGNQTTSWSVHDTGEFSPELEFSDGALWSLTSPATDASGLEPATLRLLRTGHAAETINSDANPDDMVLDSKGDAFYLLLTGRLARTTPANVSKHSTARDYGDAVLAFGDNTLLVETDGSHTTDKLVNPTTLAVKSSHSGHPGDYYGLTATREGLLHLDLDCSHNATCSNAHVRRLSLPDTADGSLQIAFASELLGPQPVVIASPANGNATLYRLS